MKPRVVIVEFQDMWGSEKAVTVPYQADFNRFDTHPDFFGASLPAFVQLAQQKGYRLVGYNRYGFNAFFVAAGIAEDLLPEVPIFACLNHPKVEYSRNHRLPIVSGYNWVEV